MVIYINIIYLICLSLYIIYFIKKYMLFVWILKKIIIPLPSLSEMRVCIYYKLPWRDGRVVDYNGLENRRTERYRGFESLSLRASCLFTGVLVNCTRICTRKPTKTCCCNTDSSVFLRL